MNTSFSFKRLVNTFKLITAYEYKKRLLHIAELSIFFLLVEIFCLRANSKDGVVYDGWQDGCMLFCAICSIFISFLGAAFLLADLKTKQKRIMMFTIPASNIEKFVVHLIHVTVGWWVGIVIAFVIADLVRIPLSYILFSPYYKVEIFHYFSSLAIVFSQSTNVMSHGVAMFFFVGSFLLLLHSAYAFGATVFRKFSFLITSVILLTLFFLTVFIGNELSSADIISINTETGEAAVYSTGYLVIFVNLLISVADYFGAYWTYKRIQVISGKWTNL